MAYTHEARSPGQLILSKEWNVIGEELQRVSGILEQDEKKESVTLPIAVRIYGKGIPKSPLSVAGGAAVGAKYAVESPAPASGLIVEGSVGIGTPTPGAKLQVAGGAIMPAAGNSEAAGILFPRDPGGGGGDSAWIRYFARKGEDTTLEIGTSNDAQDHLALMPSGNVGIGTREPGQKLQVEGNTQLNGALTVRDSVQFANKTRQMLNLWDQSYGIGIQDGTQYYRTVKNFAWFKGGSHHDAALNAGGGTAQMVLLENGNVGIGTAEPGGRLHVVHQAQDGNGGALVVGPMNAANLRLGYHADYSWVQSHGAKPLKINPVGNSVVLGEAFTVDPASKTLEWGNGSVLTGDQGGSIELGGSSTKEGTGTPYIDFHFRGKTHDYSTRLINDADGQLSVHGVLRVTGELSTPVLRTTVYSAGGAGAFGVSSANTWAKFADLEVTVTLAQAANVMIFYQISMALGNTHLVTRLLINGNEPTYRARAIHGNNVYGAPGATWVGGLAAGTNVVTVQYRSPMSGQTNSPGEDWQGRYLHVLVLGEQTPAVLRAGTINIARDIRM